MVNANDLRVVLERIRTTKARYKKVVNFKAITLKKRVEIHKTLTKELEVLDKSEFREEDREAAVNAIMKKITGLMQEALKHTELELKALNTLIHVINHPRHFPLIKAYMSQLPQLVFGLIKGPIEHIEQVLSRIRQNAVHSRDSIVAPQISW